MEVRVNKKDVIWSYLSIMVTMSSNIVVVPFIVYYLSGEMLGLWYVFVSIGAIANLFDFGFAPTFARNITYCWSGAKSLQKKDAGHFKDSEPDFVLMKGILTTCRRIYMMLAGGVFILLLTIGTLYIQHITHEVDGYTHYIAWITYSIGVFLNLYYNYFDSFLRGVGNIERSQKNRVIAKSIQIILMIVLLMLGFGILGICIAYLVFGVVFRSFGKYYFYRYKDIGKQIDQVVSNISFNESRELFKTIWYNAWREGLIQITIYCTEQASVIICSFYLSLEETGIYSLSLQIANAVAILASTLYTTYQPTIQSAYINRDYDKIRQSMAIIITSLLFLLGGGYIGTVVVGLPILSIIKPTAVVSIPILTGIFINQMILRFRNCYSSYLSCSNRLIYMNSFIISAVLCVIFSFIFMGPLHMGVWGVIIAQILSQILFNVWYWPYLVHKELDISLVGLVENGLYECKNKLEKIKDGKRK